MASLFRAAVIETLQLAPGLKKEVIVAAAATAVAPTRGAEVRCHYGRRRALNCRRDLGDKGASGVAIGVYVRLIHVNHR